MREPVLLLLFCMVISFILFVMFSTIINMNSINQSDYVEAVNVVRGNASYYVSQGNFHDEMINDMVKYFQFGLSMDDDILVNNLNNKLLPQKPAPFNCTLGNIKLDYVLWQLTGKKLKGVFMEFGAGNGLTLSRTLWLEKVKSWTGILIEADPAMRKQLAYSGRWARKYSSCLGFQKYSYVGAFGVRPKFQGRLLNTKWTIFETVIDVYCYPMYTYFLASGHTSIDLLVLDINGDEIKALSTIPWNKVDIKALLVRYLTEEDVNETVHYLTKMSPTMYEHVYNIKTVSTYLFFIQRGLYNNYRK